MDDNTTTDVPAEDTGADTALPDTSTDTTPAGTDDSDQPANNEQPSQGDDSSESSVPDVDDKLKKYAESKGIPLDSEGAVKAAKVAMDNQAEFQRTRQKTAKLEKTMLDQSDEYSEAVANQQGRDPEEVKRLNRMEVKLAKREFFDRYPDAMDHEEEIAKALTSLKIYGDTEAVLEAAWHKVQVNNADSLKSEGAKTALNNLASKQRAAAPTGSAVSSAPTSSTISRAEIQKHLSSGDVGWYEKNLPKINQLVAEGKLQ